MDAIRKQEYISRLHKQYMNDSYLNGLRQLQNKLIETAIPKIIVTAKGIQQVYDKDVQEKIDRINSEKFEYVKRYYPSLL